MNSNFQSQYIQSPETEKKNEIFDSLMDLKSKLFKRKYTITELEAEYKNFSESYNNFFQEPEKLVFSNFKVNDTQSKFNNEFSESKYEIEQDKNQIEYSNLNSSKVSFLFKSEIIQDNNQINYTNFKNDSNDTFLLDNEQASKYCTEIKYSNFKNDSLPALSKKNKKNKYEIEDYDINIISSDEEDKKSVKSYTSHFDINMD